MTITFETTEFPEYTRDPLYVLDDPELSVQFYGYTKLDGAFGDTDVILSGNPATFHGSTYMEFSEAVRYVRFSVGYIDVEGGVTVKATSPFGQVFTRTSSEVGGREFFEFDFRDSDIPLYFPKIVSSVANQQAPCNSKSIRRNSFHLHKGPDKLGKVRTFDREFDIRSDNTWRRFNQSVQRH